MPDRTQELRIRSWENTTRLLVRRAHCVVGHLEHTARVMHSTLWLGVYPGITERMLEYVLDTFRAFVAEYSGVRSRI